MHLFSADFIIADLWGYQLSLLELFATIFSMLGVVLAARRKILNWAMYLIGIVLCAILFYQFQLYGDFTLQFFFFTTSIIGWVNWERSKQENEVPITKNTFNQNLLWGFTILISSILAGIFYIHCHDWLPFLFIEKPSFPVYDGIIAVLSICGQILTMKRRRETYVIWLIANVMATVLYFVKDIKLLSIEYFIFTLIALYGFYNWNKAVKKSD